jgi:glycosyltransferase involved in cell wall biosynthesis
MRIGINAYLLHSGPGYRSAGVSVYTDRLLRALPAVAPQHEYVAYIGRDTNVPAGVLARPAPVSFHSAPTRVAWEQLALPILAPASRVDVLHGTVNVLPMLSRGPTVVTVHDLSFLRFPDRLSTARRRYLSRMVGSSARRASRVIAVSESTRADLIELASVDPGRISVVYPGVDESFRPIDGAAEHQGRVFGGRPYILHVGTLEPRKNQDILIRAFAALRAGRGIPHVLAVIGARGWMYEALFERVEELGLRDDVHFLDYVPPSELPLWYNGAELFAYPSAFEGFGLPVLEAMACGVPTITSSTSSLEELAGGACLTVEPGSVEALETAMARILDDTRLQAKLQSAGIARASAFSWEACARGTVAAYSVAAGAS